MLTLINILIIFFIVLITYQIILGNTIIEGLVNKKKNKTNKQPNISNATNKQTNISNDTDKQPNISNDTDKQPNQSIDTNKQTYSPNDTNKQTYQSFDTNNPESALILAQKNAGNIDYLKSRFDDIQGMYKQVQDLSGNVTKIQAEVNGLVSAQKAYANQLTGGVDPNITGAV
jgi:hypothetical protein